MVGSDGGDHGGSPSADEIEWITGRLHRGLSVYRRSNSGEYDWNDWDSEAMAVVEAELVRQHPERWSRYVQQALRSRHSWKVLQLMVAELAAGETWPQLVIDPVQEHQGAPLRCSPLFGWMLAVATGKIRAPTKKGPDTSVRTLRDLQIFFTVRDLKAAGLQENDACRLVAEEIGLKKERVSQIRRELVRVQRKVRRRKR